MRGGGGGGATNLCMLVICVLMSVVQLDYEK